MITGTKQEQKEFKKQIGIFEADVVCYNPDREKLEELYQTPIEKDPEYIGEKDGEEYIKVSVILRDIKSKLLFNHMFFLKNKEVVSEKEGKEIKYQFINSAGWTAWVDDASNLSEKFRAYPFHKARVGEADIIGFLDAALAFNKKEAFSIEVDWKTLMKGNMKELNDTLKTDFPRTVTAMAIVRTVEKDGNLNEYQGLWRRFLPGYNMKFFRTKKFGEDAIKQLREKQENSTHSKEYLKSYEKFVVEVCDPKYGCKDFYSFELLRDYKGGEENMVATDKVIAADDSSY